MVILDHFPGIKSDFLDAGEEPKGGHTRAPTKTLPTKPLAIDLFAISKPAPVDLATTDSTPAS